MWRRQPGDQRRRWPQGEDHGLRVPFACLDNVEVSGRPDSPSDSAGPSKRSGTYPQRRDAVNSDAFDRSFRAARTDLGEQLNMVSAARQARSGLLTPRPDAAPVGRKLAADDCDSHIAFTPGSARPLRRDLTISTSW